MVPYCGVHLVTNTARWLWDDDDIDDDTQIGTKMTFMIFLLKVLYFAVR
jgi:hypothetical protein